jgi:hypothetical protein
MVPVNVPAYELETVKLQSVNVPLAVPPEEPPKESAPKDEQRVKVPEDVVDPNEFKPVFAEQSSKTPEAI